jgi:hypothetical protein
MVARNVVNWDGGMGGEYATKASIVDVVPTVHLYDETYNHCARFDICLLFGGHVFPPAIHHISKEDDDVRVQLLGEEPALSHVKVDHNL